ncbi:MAG: PIG-L family deacetylase, partial [Armatimonadota bacterium]|nr:PIG-L family deacetylase [Armatimonadota bacterium]
MKSYGGKESRFGLRSARPWVRALSFAVLGASLLLSGTVAGVCFRIYRANARESTTGLPYHPQPGPHDRVLVVAPHCDDETLGCAGVLQHAVGAGGEVLVVFVTSGDGFGLAAWQSNPGVRLRPRHFMALAVRRQREARAALAHLGISSNRVVFLGYPDRGIAHLWLNYWSSSQPYTSPYTRVSRCPYRDARRPGTPYAGENLLRDLEELIREFQPTRIYGPSPNDDHPDHWASACFVRAAVERLGLEERVPFFTYLVHHGDWPVPQGMHPHLGLAPPASLARLDTLWSAFPVDEETLDSKEAALNEYRSQMVMRRFLLSFLRKTELFGRFPAPVECAPAPPNLRIDGRADEWGAIHRAIQEPIEEWLPTEMEGAADLTSIRFCQDDEHLYLLLTSRRKVSGRLRYQLRLRTLDEDPRALEIVVRPGKPAEGLASAVGVYGQHIEVAVPLERLGGARSLMIGAVART